MTDTTNSAPDPITQAIEALTAAARQTRTRGAGTEHEVVEPVDFAEIACHVLTTVAANVGSVEDLLAGRPGSWEADYVRQIVRSTAGEDDGLLRWRTEPVRLTLDVEGVWFDFGLYEMYEADLDAAERRARTIDHYVNQDGDHWIATEEDQAQLAAQTGRAPESWTAEDLTAAENVLERIESMIERDMAAYFEAYSAAVRLALTERGSAVAVEVTRDDRPDASGTRPWDSLGEQLHDAARARTPLPMTGQAPDWTDGTPADALRRAGLTYTARAQAI